MIAAIVGTKGMKASLEQKAWEETEVSLFIFR